ncbi:hypothetical protein HHL28_15360 [Aerophototrophica crusticola]|uniref:Conjugal transfer protein TraX n=1 Tax=Aerophototrophica crusticola TaxID=1709002 RepID=A0A858RAS2_9PROT|nr:hypothetical protein HHL28_15360 [Rhodospirillaceae bacterium B3]
MDARACRLSSLDLAKGLAITLMVVDHVGNFLFPEAEWLRVLGRGAFPIFAFLAGFLPARAFPWRILVAGLVLQPVLGVLDGWWLPFNVLVPLALWRALLSQPQAEAFLADTSRLVPLAVVCLVLAPVTGAVLEYGTAGLMFGALGVACRQGRRTEPGTLMGLVVALAGHMVLQATGFGLGWAGALAVLAVLLPVMVMLASLERRCVETTLPGVILAPIRLLARHSLWVYAVHLPMLMVVRDWLGP